MNLSNTSRYAIRILNCMAIQNTDLVSAKFLVKELNIPDKYLRQLMTKLTKSGLIQSTQGREGGYKINKPTDKLFLIEIIEAVDNLNKYLGCVLGFDECSDENPCPLHNKWSVIKKDTLHFLKTTTLKEIVNDKQTMKY